MKAEKLLNTALIAFIWYEGDEEEKNLNTLLDLLNESETREEDETYQNPVDMMFQNWKKEIRSTLRSDSIKNTKWRLAKQPKVFLFPVVRGWHHLI